MEAKESAIKMRIWKKPNDSYQGSIFPITRQKALAYSTLAFFALGIAFLMLDSPYWIVSALFFVIAILIPIVSIMWKIACWADYQIQKFLNSEDL